jgi:GTP-binding protein
MPGLTRDRKETHIRIGRHPVILTDTAGFEDAEPGSIAARMSEQTAQAIAEADLIVFMIDARTGPTAADSGIAQLVRSSGKPFVLVANKSEGRAAEAGFYGAFELGLGEPLAVSAEHALGFSDLLSEVAERLDIRSKQENPERRAMKRPGRCLNRPLKLAIGLTNAASPSRSRTLSQARSV